MTDRIEDRPSRPVAGHAPLTAVGLLMLAALVPFAAGIWLDPRIVGGAPAWLKPAKFAASIAIYSLTLAWLFRYLGAWRRTKRVAGWTTAVVFVVEMAAIAMQAWRGTTSHFNVGTPFDAAVFGVMGAAIFLQTPPAWRSPSRCGASASPIRRSGGRCGSAWP